MSSDVHNLALVGDFGGTNVRLALADLSAPLPAIREVRHFRTKDFPRAQDTVAAFLNDEGAKPATVVIAAAGPVKKGCVHFTNLGWTICENDLAAMGFSAVRIVNDFVALALATRVFGAGDTINIGDGDLDLGRNAAVLGPGTGFGASALVVESPGRAVPLAAEAGHASFAPGDEVEVEVLRHLQSRIGHVSIERILSGPGLLRLHEALNVIEDVCDVVLDSEELTQRALAGEARSLRTLNRFCAILGSVAGNLALTYGAEGGVYIAGGIVPNVMKILKASDFRRRFESKGRFVDYLCPIATHVIVRPDAAFLGAAHIARQLSEV